MRLWGVVKKLLHIEEWNGNFRRFRIGRITCWRLMSNERRVGRIIEIDSISYFGMSPIHRNDSEARKLCSVHRKKCHTHFVWGALTIFVNDFLCDIGTLKKFLCIVCTTYSTPGALQIRSNRCTDFGHTDARNWLYICFNRWHTAWFISIYSVNFWWNRLFFLSLKVEYFSGANKLNGTCWNIFL